MEIRLARAHQFLHRISQNGLLQTSGIFHGWTFAEKLVSADPHFLNAVWQLRFGWIEIGVLTGYALNYTIGYLRSQSVLSATSRGGTADFDKIRQALEHDEAIEGAEKIACDFFEGLISLLPSARAGAFVDFLKGYHRGGLRSSEAVFVTALQLGYGIGYRDGFVAGYSRGYADGYQAGYSAGISTVDGIVNGIVQAISDLETAATIVGFFV